MKKRSILESIGNTPTIKINKLFNPSVEVWMKLEQDNPAGSIKDRIALAMIEAAEKEGIINKDTIIIEPTSGNTGVGLAMVCAVKGYALKLVMPESMSMERRKLMAAYGAEVVLTPKELGTAGAVEKALKLAESLPNSWVPHQFNNMANPEVHRRTTAKEVLDDFPDGFDYLITGVGTGGHITGVGQVLKAKFPKIEVYAVEPEDSPVLSGGKAGPHPLQGIGAGFIPKVLDQSVLNGVLKVKDKDAFYYTQQLAKKEGILAGVSTGAALAAIAEFIKTVPKGSRILTFNYDTGERYLSLPDLF